MSVVMRNSIFLLSAYNETVFKAIYKKLDKYSRELIYRLPKLQYQLLRKKPSLRIQHLNSRNFLIKEYELNNQTISFIYDFIMYSLEILFKIKYYELIQIMYHSDFGKKHLLSGLENTLNKIINNSDHIFYEIILLLSHIG